MKRIILFAALCMFAAAAAPAADTIRSLIDARTLPEMRWPDVKEAVRPLDSFYRARNDAPAWSRDGQPTPQALALTKLFAAADAKGLNASDYDGDRWAGRIASFRNATDEAIARFDVELTATLIRYISDLHVGRINPRRVEFFLDVTPTHDVESIVASLVDAADVPAKLEAVEPPFDGYRRLRDALTLYRGLATDHDMTPLPAATMVEPGAAWEGVPQLAALLRRVNDLEVPFTSDRYEGALVDAVKRFQRRHGLDADGRIGPATLAVLNVPFSARVEQIQLSLERWRWVPLEFSGPPIVVNIPEFRLRAYEGPGREPLTMNVVVGSAYPSRQTPVFAETMKYVVFRPYWNVPPSIQQKELKPKLAKDPGYLKRNNYEVVNGSIRQKPGPNNALGNVKFMMPNPMNIYLHDTSSRDLFSRSRRDFSHGCIRVGDPAALAEWVLRDDPKWTAEAIRKAMTSGPENATVPVKRPIPVLIVYATVVAPPDGKVYFFDDIYGHDTTLRDALAAGYPYQE